MAGQQIATRVQVQNQSGIFYYVFTDRLGSVAAMRQGEGSWVSGNHARFDPFGNYRLEPADSVNPGISNRGFTGHRHNNTLGGDNYLPVIYMNARFYLPEVGRFASPDTLVPDPGNPQSFNRYSYVNNSPANFTDPTGHCLQYSGEDGDQGELGACLQAWNQLGEHYGHVTGYGDQYPNAYMLHLLESASTDELVSILSGFGLEYLDPRESTTGDYVPSSYYAITAGAGPGLNVEGSIIIDIYGNVYGSLGGALGVPGFSGSTTSGWVLAGSARDFEAVIVDEAQLESLLSGGSIYASGGFGPGATIVHPFGETNEGFALAETGVYLPQAGAGAQYSAMLYDANTNRGPNLLNSRFEYWYWYQYER